MIMKNLRRKINQDSFWEKQRACERSEEAVQECTLKCNTWVMVFLRVKPEKILPDTNKKIRKTGVRK